MLASFVGLLILAENVCVEKKERNEIDFRMEVGTFILSVTNMTCKLKLFITQPAYPIYFFRNLK